MICDYYLVNVPLVLKRLVSVIKILGNQITYPTKITSKKVIRRVN